jgi:hypothetical protein
LFIPIIQIAIENMSLREGAGRSKAGSKGGEMTQTLYAHLNKRKNNKKI